MAFSLKKNSSGEARSRPVKVAKTGLKKGGGKHFTLLIGDEGGILLFMEGAKVVRRLFAPTPQPANTEAISELMLANPTVPISILVDNMDQQYVRQSFPPVSSLSLNGLVKRRLDRDFQTEDIKGALPLGRDKTGRKEWNFLLVSLTRTALLNDWINLIIELPNPFVGIYLAPIESINYLDQLSSTFATTQTPWKLLVTHNKVSGFRQVVSNGGKLVFTRVTHTMDDAIPAVIAGNIEQEIINTIEYLRRLGFEDNSALSLFVVASSDVNEALDLGRFGLTNASALTPLDIADALGFDQAALSADRFGDVVMSAAFARSKKHRLKFSTAYADALNKLYSTRKLIKIGTAFLALALLLLSAQNILGSMENKSLLKTTESKRTSLSVQLKDLQTKVDGLNKNLAFKSAVVTTYDAYLKDAPLPITFIAALAPHLTNETHMLKIEWNRGDPSKLPAGNSASNPTATKSDPKLVTVRAEFEMVGKYPDVESLAKATQSFLDKLTATMPDYKITHEPFAWEKEAEKGMEITFDQRLNNSPKDGNTRFVVIFTGPIKKDGTATAAGATPSVTSQVGAP